MITIAIWYSTWLLNPRRQFNWHSFNDPVFKHCSLFSNVICKCIPSCFVKCLNSCSHGKFKMATTIEKSLIKDIIGNQVINVWRYKKRTDSTLTERKGTNIKSKVHKTLHRYKKIHKPTGEGGPQISQYGKQCTLHWFIRRVTRVKNALIRHDRGTRDGVMTTTTRTYMWQMLFTSS